MVSIFLEDGLIWQLYDAKHWIVLPWLPSQKVEKYVPAFKILNIGTYCPLEYGLQFNKPCKFGKRHIDEPSKNVIHQHVPKELGVIEKVFFG